MDLSNRGTPLHQASSPQAGLGGNNVSHNKKQGDWSRSRLFRLAQAFLMLCVVLVLVGVLVFLTVNSNQNESKYVQTNKLQAVFLNTGQVYFGDIKALNNNYLVLTNIFYLQTSSSNTSTSTSSSSTNANTSVSLVKLGCELHAPLDQMIINRESVTFWENLSPSGQVSKAVATYEKNNPDGQKCSDQSTAGTSGQSTPQAATNDTSTTTTTGSTSTTK